MIWRSIHICVIIGVCILEIIAHGTSVDNGKLKNRTSKDHENKLHSLFEKNSPNIDIDIGLDVNALLASEENNFKRLERKIKNDTDCIKNSVSKIYNINKKRSIHAPAAAEDNKSSIKRDNIFLRLFSDNYKPHKQRQISKKKRDTNSVIRKVEILGNDTKSFPPIPHSFLPLTHFVNKDGRKINNDNICKTQIIKIFPKPKKIFESKFDTSNKSHKQSMFDNGNDEWEVRQDIFEEEILPFKSDFGFDDIFQDEPRGMFDDILSIVSRMLPHSFFDTVYIKLQSTEKPKTIIKSGIEQFPNEHLNYFIENLRNKRQAGLSSITPHFNSQLTTTSGLSKEGSINTNHNNDIDSLISTIITLANDNASATDESLISTAKAMLNNTNEEMTHLTVNINTGDKQHSTDANTLNMKLSSDPLSAEVTNTVSKLKHSTSSVKESTYNQEADNKLSISLFDTADSEPGEMDLNSGTKNVNPNHVDMRDERIHEAALPNEEGDSDTSKRDTNVFFIILGVIPGIVGLVIVIGVVTVWVVQKKSEWVVQNSGTNETGPGPNPQPKSGVTC